MKISSIDDEKINRLYVSEEKKLTVIKEINRFSLSAR